MITTMPSDQNGPPPRVEVITSVQRRRRWPTAEKIRLVEETMQPGMSVSYVARRAGVAPSLLFNWRKGKPAINAKRVLRIMEVNKLTLERHTGRRPGRTHDGVVIALRSNIRWCSDHFELACRNGELLRVLFAIDACDREVIAWSATTAGIVLDY